jgi:hypothetical protein
MKQTEENIQLAVPQDYIAPIKAPLYRSKFPGNLPPTGSTFGLHTTSAKVLQQLWI